MYKTKSFREKLVCVLGSTFLIFMFVDQLLLVDVFSQLYYLTYAKKQQCRTYRYKSLKSWKIDNIDLTQQFSLSIFTDFRYQSIKITWLLPIYIDWLLRVEITMLLLAPKFPLSFPLLTPASQATITMAKYVFHFNNTDSNISRLTATFIFQSKTKKRYLIIPFNYICISFLTNQSSHRCLLYFNR